MPSPYWGSSIGSTTLSLLHGAGDDSSDPDARWSNATAWGIWDLSSAATESCASCQVMDGGTPLPYPDGGPCLSFTTGIPISSTSPQSGPWPGSWPIWCVTNLDGGVPSTICDGSP